VRRKCEQKIHRCENSEPAYASCKTGSQEEICSQWRNTALLLNLCNLEAT
jgi:hypothetical protein